MRNVMNLTNRQRHLIFHKFDLVCLAQAVEAVRPGVLHIKDPVVL